MTRTRVALALAVLGYAGGLFTAQGSMQSLDVGRVLTADELRAVDRTVFADGRNLPPGSGTAIEGATVYGSRCRACHGAGGAGGPADRLVGGQGSLASAMPLKTVTSYWPYATTLFDYIQRAMPLRSPGSLTSDEVYAVTAYLLAQGGIIGETARMDASTLPRVEMPNRNGFRVDPRPAVGPFVR
ncbi:MAG: c-type cytochrome [Vicinamibacterales bacterium]